MCIEKIIFDNYMTRMCRKKEVLAHKYGIALITATHDNKFLKSFNKVYKLKDSKLSVIDE